MALCALWIVLAAAPDGAFTLRDVETVDGRPVNRYRPMELGPRPVRPVTWEVPPPAGVTYGVLRVGPRPESAPAVAWDPESSTLWIDANANRRLDRDERHKVTGAAVAAVEVTIGDALPVRRTVLVRPGLLGGAPRYTVRGAMAGTLALGGRPMPVLLVDGDADGCFDAPGTDRVWVDLDGDGRFDPVAETFPLGTPIRVGGTSYTVASDAWAYAVAAHERDARVGRVRLHLGTAAPSGKVTAVAASLVSTTGELVTVSALDTSAEAPVGRYRVASLTLEVAERSGRAWVYTFTGGGAATIEVTPGGETRSDLLAGLALEVTAAVHGDARSGDDIDATPHLRLPSGLYLANCTTRLGQGARDQQRSAAIVLKAPDGAMLDRAVSGFA